MSALDLLARLRAAGLVLSLTPEDDLHVGSMRALTSAERAALVAERDAVVAELRREAEAAAEARRVRALAMLEAEPELGLAVVVDDAAGEPWTRAAVAVRGREVMKLAIPAGEAELDRLIDLFESYADDPGVLVELIARHCRGDAPVH